MRLPFFNHVAYNGPNDYSYKLVEVAQFFPSRRYTVEEILSAFPAVKEQKQILSEVLMDSVRSSESFAAWKELHEETKRRLLAMTPLTINSDGEWAHVRGICHNGQGDTGIFINLRSGAYGCHKGCETTDIRRALGLPERPLNSSSSSESQSRVDAGKAAFPKLDRQKALYGLAGEVVKAIEPHSEADPVALLVQLLVSFGSVIGRSAHFEAEADRHYTNLFTVIVGESSRGRKGSSLGHIRRLLEEADAGWAGCITGGLTSGEGLVHHVRDENVDFMPRAVRESKRALVIESEFASVLRVQKREGNTLSTIIRQAWDTGNLNVMRRNHPDKATNAHISIIGHVTSDELRRCLQDTDAVNGYANRFLWVCARRSKKLPEGGYFNQTDISPLIVRLRGAVEFARTAGMMKRDEDARLLWRQIYSQLDDEISSGRLGAIVSRAEAQVMRLACVYALLDCSEVVKRVHLEAAKAVWDYCVASARYIFSTHVLSKRAQKFLDALRDAADVGLNKTELYRRNGNRTDGVDEALAELREADFAISKSVPTAGRTEERWFVVKADVRTCDFDEESSKDEEFDSSTSSNSALRAA